MAWISSRYMRIGALVVSGFFFPPASVRAGTLSEDGGAGVFRLQSAELPEETVLGFGFYNRFVNLDGGGPFNSLLKGHSVTMPDSTVNPTLDSAVEPAKLWALDHVLSASVSTHGFFEAHVAVPLYTQSLYYGVGHTQTLAMGDIRYGIKIASPIDEKHPPIAMALLLGGSLPGQLSTVAVPVPRRLEFFPADSIAGTDKSHAIATRLMDWHLTAAATIDLERYSVPLQWHFNVGARKTGAINVSPWKADRNNRDADFYDIFSAGTGFESRFHPSWSVMGEYWHENRIENTSSNPQLNDISLGAAYHTPIGLSIMLGGGMALTNGAGTPVTFYDDKGKHQYDLSARSSPDAQIILAVTYTLGFKPKDTDGDGVPDAIDKCPAIPQGLNGKDGCPNPDSDNDGICDPWVSEAGLRRQFAPVCTGIDNCPNEAQGPSGVDGCPVRDSDGDGIPDNIDKCPNEPQGLNGKDGCPMRDADGDGVPDDVDQCPNRPGPAWNNGCPEPMKRLAVQQKTLILKGVTFETGKAIMLPVSFPVLDDIAAQLASAPDVELEVSGHTDDRGGASLNLKLSRLRAQAVADYLIGKGVAASRLKVVGYGSDKPIASNRTADGRSQNRRVEFNRLK